MPAPKDFRLCNMPVQYDWIRGLALRGSALVGQALRDDRQSARADGRSRLAPVPYSVSSSQKIGGRPRFRQQRRLCEPSSAGSSSPTAVLKHDLTAFDKYLEMVAKSVGTAAAVAAAGVAGVRGQGATESRRMLPASPPPEVSVFDPTTGKIERMKTPSPATDGPKRWRSGGRFSTTFSSASRTAAGWTRRPSVGSAFYGGPDDDVAKLAQELWPARRLVHRVPMRSTASGATRTTPGSRSATRNRAYDFGIPSVRGYRALLEPRPVLLADVFVRIWRDYSPLTHQRRTAEDIAMSGMDGVGDFGTDLFTYRRSRTAKSAEPGVDENRPSGPRTDPDVHALSGARRPGGHRALGDGPRGRR